MQNIQIEKPRKLHADRLLERRTIAHKADKKY